MQANLFIGTAKMANKTVLNAATIVMRATIHFVLSLIIVVVSVSIDTNT